MWEDLKRGRLFGHPIHAIAVHFPVGLLSGGYLFDILTHFVELPYMGFTGFYCIVLGVASSFIAALFGLIDFLNLAYQKRLLQKMSRHAIVQSIALILFVIAIGLRLNNFPDANNPTSFSVLALETIAISLMFFGNYLGGELIFNHRIGVSEKKKT